MESELLFSPVVVRCSRLCSLFVSVIYSGRKEKKEQGFKEIDSTVVERRNWASCAAPENNRPSLNSPGGALVCFVFVSISSIAPLSDQIIQGECVCFQL